MPKKFKSSLFQASAINHLFLFFILAAILYAASNGRMKEVSEASIESAQAAVALLLKMLGVMALWLGLMRVLEAGGLMQKIARLLKPLMVKLFPDVPAEHPAMSAMILNISANVLGLGNAATPFGLKAMVELDKLNPLKGTATNAMCLFLAINTSSVTLLPLGAISILAAAGNKMPSAIIVPTLIATCISTVVAIICAFLFAKSDSKYLEESKGQKTFNSKEDKVCNDKFIVDTYPHLLVEVRPLHKLVSFMCTLSFVSLLAYRMLSSLDVLIFIKEEFVSYWLIPGLIFFMLVYGISSGVKVYEAVCEGAKQGFDIVVKIIPFLVSILVAIGMFRASGAMDLMVSMFGPITNLIGMPADVLPMAIMRPLSGSGAMGVLSSIVEQAPNSYSAFLAATINGCTETTFYVLAVYFGSVGVIRIRHALVVGIIADVVGVLAACAACRFFWV